MNPVKGQVMSFREALSNIEDCNGKKVEFKQNGTSFSGEGSDGRTYLFDVPDPTISINFISTAVVKEENKKKLDETVKELDKDALAKEKEATKKVASNKK